MMAMTGFDRGRGKTDGGAGYDWPDGCLGDAAVRL